MSNSTKKRDGYVIAQHKSSSVCFTSSSAYDCPKWVALTEATVYPTAELATTAARKLWLRGAYGAAVRHLTELAGLELDMGNDEVADLPPADGEETAMSAKERETPPVDAVRGVCPDCDCDPCECDDQDSIDPDPSVDDLATDVDGDIDVDPELEREVSAPTDEIPPEKTGAESEENAFLRPEEVEMINRRRPVGESADKVNFKDPSVKDQTATMELVDGEKVNVPSYIKKQLKSKIEELTKVYNDNNMRDDETGSKALTAVHALEQLLDDLSLGTVAGMKQAQVHMTSYMNVITSLIPADVTKFILKGGKTSTLKDLFGTKWEGVRKEKE